MDLATLVTNYGYLAVFIGTFLEGESILVIASFFAHSGYLKLEYVILFAFVGTFFGDQLYFYIGRLKGREFIEKRPVWVKKSEKVLNLMDRHSTLLILGFRFLYGIRIVTPFVLGMTKVSPLKYLVFNFIGAFVWALIIGVLGYFFGQTLEYVIGEIKEYEKIILFIFIVSSIIIYYLYDIHKKTLLT